MVPLDRQDPGLWNQALIADGDALLRRAAKLNRAGALAEIAGPAAALAELETLDAARLADFQPFHAVRASLLARLGRRDEALLAYDRALALGPAAAERRRLIRRRMELRQAYQTPDFPGERRGSRKKSAASPTPPASPGTAPARHGPRRSPRHRA
jgi:predicted RNA polymerase sigma factor